jgi:hypothetical protein
MKPHAQIRVGWLSSLIFLCVAAAGLQSFGAEAPDESKADIELAGLKTFGTSGKEKFILGGGKEAELFRRDGAGRSCFWRSETHHLLDLPLGLRVVIAARC